MNAPRIITHVFQKNIYQQLIKQMNDDIIRNKIKQQMMIYAATVKKSNNDNEYMSRGCHKDVS